ncbi:MAG: sigma-54 dependent transcriptional regulator [Polyangiaceae bacterium]|nr:sigma-54 dependent transcriptional regulator [Polyangiaceae bacterium]
MKEKTDMRVFIVDDDSDLGELLRLTFKAHFEVEVFTDAEAALGRLEDSQVAAVLTDVLMPQMNGLEFCRRLRQKQPHLPIVVMTSANSLETAFQAIQAGADDFLSKPFTPAGALLRLQRVISESESKKEVLRLQRVITRGGEFDGIVGESTPMRAMKDKLVRVAPTEASVLVTGESGTGKELAARFVHDAGARSRGPFIAVNCSALPEALLESELFGHKKGAFTDARSDREGLFVQASGGTLFLDEIGELPLGLQPKLLRALEERKIRAVGGSGETAVDFRLVAATNRDLAGAVAEGRFREDLYYRLDVVKVTLPPLRARGTDILLLAKLFAAEFSKQGSKRVVGFALDAERRLLAYPWPGNVRELRNAIQHAVVLTLSEQIQADDLPERIAEYRASDVLVAALDPTELVPMEEVERRYVLRVMEAVGGNKVEAARILGFDRRTLYRKLQHYEEVKA